MTDQAPPPQWVNKIDVAERQLCAAVRFFFERRDPIIVHALVAAGHQVLTDIGSASGVVGALKSRDKASAQIGHLNHAANFFKHADRDPQSRINIAPLSDLSAEFLMDAVVLLQQLKGSLSTEAQVFWSWFVTKHRDLFEDSAAALRSLIDPTLDVDDFDAIVALLAVSDALRPGAILTGNDAS